MVELSIKLRGAWADGDGAQQEERPLNIKIVEGRHDNWSKVHADQEYSLNVNLKRLNHCKVSMKIA